MTALPAPGAMRPLKSELYTTARSEVSVTECLDPDKDRAEDAKGGEADSEASDETLANMRLVMKEMYKSSGCSWPRESRRRQKGP